MQWSAGYNVHFRNSANPGLCLRLWVLRILKFMKKNSNLQDILTKKIFLNSFSDIFFVEECSKNVTFF